MATEKERPKPDPEAGQRFAEPFGSQAWHEDGREFTDAEYRKAGLTPPHSRATEGVGATRPRGPLVCFDQYCPKG